MDKQHALIIRILHQPGKKADEPEYSSEKIGREAFLYMEGSNDDFAQCGSCWLFVPEKNRCAILGSDFEVKADDSCCFYIKGEPVEGQPIVERVTPEEAGFVRREVRCENCLYGDDKCQLFVSLNKKFPDMFDLEEEISPLGCCNANTEKE